MEFGVTKEQTGPASWLARPHGEVDLYTSPALRAELFSVIYSGVGNVVVDLSATTAFDSTALGDLLAAHKRLRRGAVLSIVSSDRSTLRIFQVTGLDRVFPIHDTLELALNANAGPAPTFS